MRTNCEHCNALVTPGASFCLACFLPFEDMNPEPEPPAAAAPAGVPYGAPVPAAVGAQAGGPDDFFAAPPPSPQFMHHPGQGVDWRMQAPAAAMLTPQRKPPSRTPMVVMAVVGVLVLVGGFFGAKALLSSPSEKERFAIAFREARPPDLLPSLPDLGSFIGSDEPEAPGQAKAFVQSIDPQVRAANDALLGMQKTMDRWADGKVNDDQLREAIRALNKTLGAAASTDKIIEAPGTARRGMSKLAEATTEYNLALGALMDWMDSQSGGSRLTYRLTIGSANIHWDEGLINLYRAGGLPAPPLPHPQPKRK